MAEGKKSFIAYVDWKETFNSLPDEKAGQLIKHLFAYVSDENPTTDDVLINAVFANIKQTLKRDLRKYETIREKRSLAGKASADKRQQVLTSVNKPQQTSTNSTVNDNVNVNVNVNDNDNDNDTLLTKTWKEDYQVYLKECKEGYRCFMEDPEMIKTQQRLNPNVNIKLSIEKGFVNFWSTEAGWKHKKKSRSKEIDWRSTIINSIDMNKVYYTKDEMMDRDKKPIQSIKILNREEYK